MASFVVFSCDSSSSKTLVALARVFCGSIAVGDTVHILHPRYDWQKPTEDTYTQTQVSDLFLLMGRHLRPVDRVEAGNLVGIGGSTLSYFLSSTS